MQGKEELSITPLTADQLHTMAGTYQDPTRGDVWRFSESHGKLLVDFDGVLLELRAVNAREFEPTPYPMEAGFKFEPAQPHSVRKWIIDTGFQLPITVQQIDEANPSLTALAAYAGNTGVMS